LVLYEFKLIWNLFEIYDNNVLNFI